VHWLSLAVASAAFLGLYEVSRKAAVRSNAVLPVLLCANVGGLASLCLLLGAAALNPSFAGNTGLVVQPLSAPMHLAVFAKACIVTTSWVLAYVAVKHLPISIAAPLRSVSPAITVLGALVIFGESPDAKKWLGMTVIFAGYLGFAWLGRKEGIRFVADRWVLLLVLGTCVGAMSGLYDKVLLQRARLHPTTLQLWFTVYNVALQVVLCAAFWWRQRAMVPFSLRWTVPMVGVLLVAADQLYFRALAQEKALVSVVALARRGSVLVSFTWGGWLFREQLLKQKSWALALILVGLLILLKG